MRSGAVLNDLLCDVSCIMYWLDKLFLTWWIHFEKINTLNSSETEHPDRISNLHVKLSDEIEYNEIICKLAKTLEKIMS